MTATLIGFKRVEFTSKKDGQLKRGYNMYFEFPARNTEGMACQSVYFSDGKLYGFTPAVGLLCDYEVNQYGSGCFIRESVV